MIKLLTEEINANSFGDITNENTEAFGKLWLGIDSYLHGGGYYSSDNLYDAVKDPEVQKLIKQLQELTLKEWGHPTKKLYRGMALTTREPKRIPGALSAYSNTYKSLPKREMDKVVLKKKGEHFRFTSGKERPFQHWTPSYKVALHFAERNQFRWHDIVVISASIPYDMVIVDMDTVGEELLKSSMMRYVKEKEKEVIVWHKKPIECVMEYNSYDKT